MITSIYYAKRRAEKAKNKPLKPIHKTKFYSLIKYIINLKTKK